MSYKAPQPPRRPSPPVERARHTRTHTHRQTHKQSTLRCSLGGRALSGRTNDMARPRDARQINNLSSNNSGHNEKRSDGACADRDYTNPQDFTKRDSSTLLSGIGAVVSSAPNKITPNSGGVGNWHR